MRRSLWVYEGDEHRHWCDACDGFWAHADDQCGGLAPLLRAAGIRTREDAPCPDHADGYWRDGVA